MEHFTKNKPPKRKLGGDLWNDYKLFNSVFERYPEANSFTIYYRGTGLWVDVILDNGRAVTIFDR